MVFVPEGLKEWPEAILTQPDNPMIQFEFDEWLQSLTEFDVTGFFYHVSRVYPQGRDIAVAAKYRIVKLQENFPTKISGSAVQFSNFEDDEFPLNLNTWQGASVIAFDTLTYLLHGCVEFAGSVWNKYNHESKEWFEAFNAFLLTVQEQAGGQDVSAADIQRHMNNAVVLAVSRTGAGVGARESLDLQVEDLVFHTNAKATLDCIAPETYAKGGLRVGQDGWIERVD